MISVWKQKPDIKDSDIPLVRKALLVAYAKAWSKDAESDTYGDGVLYGDLYIRLGGDRNNLDIVTDPENLP